MFNFTTGELLFYGGIIGMCIMVVAAIIVTATLASSRKRMRSTFNEEYGNDKK